MKRFNLRDGFGFGLIILGALMLLENLGILRGGTGLFFGALILMVAVYFFGNYIRNPRAGWWNIIPAMALLGMALESLLGALLPKALTFLAGSSFLICLGLAFLLVYAADRARWWGIIPGGVLLTLATVNITHTPNEPGLLLLGLGITFLLVGLLPTGGGANEWAFIPALILIAIGAFLFSGTSLALIQTYLPWILIGLGVLTILRFMVGKKG